MKRKRVSGRRSVQSVAKEDREILALYFKNVVDNGISLKQLTEAVTRDFVRAYNCNNLLFYFFL